MDERAQWEARATVCIDLPQVECVRCERHERSVRQLIQAAEHQRVECRSARGHQLADALVSDLHGMSFKIRFIRTLLVQLRSSPVKRSHIERSQAYSYFYSNLTIRSGNNTWVHALRLRKRSGGRRVESCSRRSSVTVFIADTSSSSRAGHSCTSWLRTGPLIWTHKSTYTVETYDMSK